jgi:hypothetical protein
MRRDETGGGRMGLVPLMIVIMMKTYLEVPFAKKDLAKKLGAKWDFATRQWYWEGGAIHPGLNKFLVGGSYKFEDRYRDAMKNFNERKKLMKKKRG